MKKFTKKFKISVIIFSIGCLAILAYTAVQLNSKGSGEKKEIKDEYSNISKYIGEQILIIENQIKSALGDDVEANIEYEIVDESDYTTTKFFGTVDKVLDHTFEKQTTEELDIGSYEIIYPNNESGVMAFEYIDSTLVFDNKIILKIGVNNLDEVNDDGSVTIENKASLISVVNKNRALGPNYYPENLVSITVSSTKSGQNNLVRQEVLPDLEAMFDAASAENINLTVTSAFRSYDTQYSLFNNYVSTHGFEQASRFSAPPGKSEHQTGLVLDIGTPGGSVNFDAAFGKTQAGIWLANNAHNYGFILRYPEGKEAITTYIYEPWHFRYVGKDIAPIIYESGLTMEEFFLIN